MPVGLCLFEKQAKYQVVLVLWIATSTVAHNSILSWSQTDMVLATRRYKVVHSEDNMSILATTYNTAFQTSAHNSVSSGSISEMVLASNENKVVTMITCPQYSHPHATPYHMGPLRTLCQLQKGAKWLPW